MNEWTFKPESLEMTKGTKKATWYTEEGRNITNKGAEIKQKREKVFYIILKKTFYFEENPLPI